MRSNPSSDWRIEEIAQEVGWHFGGDEKVGFISTLDPIQDLDDAITYYGNLQKRQVADEIAVTQQAIVALEKEHGALQRLAGLQQMQEEADEINALTGREHCVKIKDIGFEVLASKTQELERPLNDIGNLPINGHRE